MIRRILILLALSLASLAAAQGTGRPEFQGYWMLGEDEDSSYDKYLKIRGDSGYYCVRDDKSSFRFKIRGDSITTPMNGMDAIRLTSPTTLRISGEEKGVAYSTDFRSMPASGYPAACEEEERRLYGGPTALAPGRGGSTGPSGKAGVSQFDAAGRSLRSAGAARRIFPRH